MNIVKKVSQMDRRTEGQTDRQTDRWMDRRVFRAAALQQKASVNYEYIFGTMSYKLG